MHRKMGVRFGPRRFAQEVQVGVYVVVLLLLLVSTSSSSGSYLTSTSDWRPPCPATLQNCENGTGLVTFSRGPYARLEFAREGFYKDLVCRPKNFCSIEWLRDGLPYPWGWSHEELGRMGVSQGTCNSTLELKRAERWAQGVYTCLVTGANGTTISRNITLRVQAAPKPVPPIPAAGDLCANHTAQLGSDVNFTCAIYVGEAHMPMSYAYWMVEVDPGNWVFGNLVHIPGSTVMISESRGSDGYLTTTLRIDTVTSGTYVNYRLFASNGALNSETNFHLHAPTPESQHVSKKIANGWRHRRKFAFASFHRQ